MSKNKKLNKAKNLKNDEFYTLYSSIEKELQYYHEQLKDKTIYLNCDNPKYSEFYKYFKNNFNTIRPKKIIFIALLMEYKKSFLIIETSLQK